MAALLSLLLAGATLGNCAPYATKFLSGKDVEVSIYTPTMFRIRVSSLQGEKFPAEYEIPFVIGKVDSWPQVSARSWSDGDFDIIETSKLRIRISRVDHTWTVWSEAGERRIYPSDGPVYGIFRDGYTEFDSASALGQKTAYNRYAHWFYNPETKRYVDTYLGDDEIYDQYFIYGPDYPSLFSQLNELVGPEPLLPRKAFGFFQTEHIGCKGSQTQLMDIARKFRERHIPADTLILDYDWGDGCPGGDEDSKYWGQLEWSEGYKQPLSPSEMMAKLHEMHFDVMLIHHSVPDYQNRDKALKRDPEFTWTSHVYDAKYWWTKVREELDSGVSGTWQDTRKNDVTDSVIYGGLQDIFGESRRVLFMGNRDMMKEDPWSMGRDSPPFTSLLASRRYPFRWTGDLSTSWSELQWQIDAISNTYGPMSGVDYITADAFGADWKQQARWNQFLSFTPVARSHTMKPWDISLDTKSLARIMAFGDQAHENDDSAKPPDEAEIARLAAMHSQKLPTAENSIRKILGLRYRLLPYLYSYAYEQYRTGYPILRPMVLAFPDDLACRYNRERYQYMFGDAFLVAPVWADLNSMDIYLPKGYDWIDYWTKKVYHGGQTISYDTSDVERLPLFVKAGSMIPMEKQAEWIDPVVAADPLSVDIYPAEKPSAFTLYEDDGVTTRYESGEYATTAFQLSEERGEISVAIGATLGEYKGKPESRRIALVIHLPQAPLKVMRNGVAMHKAESGDSWSYNAQSHTVNVSLTKAASEKTEIGIINGPR